MAAREGSALVGAQASPSSGLSNRHLLGWFSGSYQNPLEGLLKHRLLGPASESDSVGLGWGQRGCNSSTFQSAASAVGWRPCLQTRSLLFASGGPRLDTGHQRGKGKLPPHLPREGRPYATLEVPPPHRAACVLRCVGSVNPCPRGWGVPTQVTNASLSWTLQERLGLSVAF